MRKIAYMRSDRRDSYFNVVESEVVGTDVDDVELSLFLNIAKRLGFNVGYLYIFLCAIALADGWCSLGQRANHGIGFVQPPSANWSCSHEQMDSRAAWQTRSNALQYLQICIVY